MSEPDEHTTPAPVPGLVPTMGIGPCMQCGYDLRGTPVTANCSECGTPVAESMPEYPLAVASAADREKLRAGLMLISLSLVAVVLAGAVLLFTPTPVSIMLWFLGMILAVVGSLLLAARIGDAPRSRAATTLAVGGHIIAALSIAAFGLPDGPGWATIAWVGCFIAAGTTTLIASGHVCAQLAKRILSLRALRAARRYTRWAKILSIAAAIAPFAVWGVFKIMEANHGPQTGFDGLALVLGAMMLTGIPLLIITLITAVMFFIMTTSLRRALKPLAARS